MRLGYFVLFLACIALYACSEDENFSRRTNYVVIDSLRTDLLFYQKFDPVKDIKLSNAIENKTITIDINEDALADISFTASQNNTTSQTIKSLKTKTLNGKLKVALINSLAFPKTFSYKDLIEEKERWESGEFLMAYYERSPSSAVRDSISGTWNSKTDYYIGLRLEKQDASISYGWIKLSVSNYNLLEVKETALQR
ncbi:hypothetical protein [Pedobacter puniceum]|jgi:hypothetical protein|uniref:DUF5017 domain-containing protein n=1 Tax=Pedobacter puniceum TaxID=2666136 RepID=A0A7K0FI39_9SPHI|nr:hypothetical protein [Pedobacter puniceum]MRX45649.1 hypothetical protein [Pedobacter puniceum]